MSQTKTPEQSGPPADDIQRDDPRFIRFVIPTHLLELTKGKQLPDWQRHLIENAIKGYYTARSKQLLLKFYEQVQKGDYDYELHQFIELFMPDLT